VWGLKLQQPFFQKNNCAACLPLLCQRDVLVCMSICIALLLCFLRLNGLVAPLVLSTQTWVLCLRLSVVSALAKSSWVAMVHYPCLVQRMSAYKNMMMMMVCFRFYCQKTLSSRACDFDCE
jgi:hypothetical protein